MKTSTAILLLGAGAGVVILGGIAYKNSVRNLRFTLADITINSRGEIGLMIQVINPSHCFGYPVPGLFFNVFDAQSNYLGSLRSDIMQWVGANGVSYIYAWLLPNYLQLGSILKNLLLPGVHDRLLLNGVIKVKDFQIPVETVLET